MELHLEHKRVLITGGSRGIGLAMAAGFLRHGAKVALLARSAATLSQAADQLAREHGEERVMTLEADCSTAGAWPDVLSTVRDAWDGLDIVIANAGDGRSVPDAMPEAERFAAGLRANLATAEHTARATLPLLATSGGCLLFVSSIAGIEAGPAPTDYSVAKAAVVALSKQLARRMAPRVRVNCLAPGNVLFPGGNWEAKLQATPERVEAMIESSVPMRRFGTPGEIADAALFLCSDRASFVTGCCLAIDGGQSVSWH